MVLIIVLIVETLPPEFEGNTILKRWILSASSFYYTRSVKHSGRDSIAWREMIFALIWVLPVVFCRYIMKQAEQFAKLTGGY